MIHYVKNNSDTWLALPWKQYERNTLRLQKRIYKASQMDNPAKVLKLQQLMFASYQTRMLAIRQVTQLNQGKKMAGIDGKKELSNAERFELEKELHLNAKNWKHCPLREVAIPKSNGSQRILKIPTMKDRAWQCVIKMVIEPAHEAKFHEKSSKKPRFFIGFRPGRGTHDAQKRLFLNLSSRANGKVKKVIELDIEKCFDRINHQTLLDKIDAPKRLKTLLARCFKVGVHPGYPKHGTSQGGVVSPFLANIALNGIETIHPSIRYADDMIFILKPHDNENQILDHIETFLKSRGMNISEKKTRITAATKGFDFLGWHFKRPQRWPI